MLKRKLIDKLTDEKGSGLVLTLMVLLVLSVLGASLGVVTIGSLQLSTVNRDTNSAYYIAEAGANMAYEEFKRSVSKSFDNSENSTDFYTGINSDMIEFFTEKKYNENIFTKQHGKYPTAKVKFTKEDTGDIRKYKIQSTGIVDQKERTVEKEVLVRWIEKEVIDEDVVTISKYTGIWTNGNLIIKEKGSVSEAHIYMEQSKDAKFELNGRLVSSSMFINMYKGELEVAIEDKAQIVSSILYISNHTDNTKEDKLILEIKKPKNIISSTIYVPLKDTDLNMVLPKSAVVTHYVASDAKDVAIDFTKLQKEVKALGNFKYNNLPPLPLNNIQKKLEEGHKKYKLNNPWKEGKEYIFDIKDKDIMIFAEELELEDVTIKVLGTGSLTFVVREKIEFKGSTKFNKEGNNVRIISTSGEEVSIEDQSTVVAQIIAPLSKFILNSKVKNDEEYEFQGSVAARKVNIEKGKFRKRDFQFNNSTDGEESGGGGEYDIIPGPTIESDQ